jgi:regulator of cell morphogenesis and NO signaling
MADSTTCPVCSGYVAELGHEARHDHAPAAQGDSSIRTDIPLGELARDRPAAVPLLERLGLDYCCGGRVALADACAERRLDVTTVVATIETLTRIDHSKRAPHDVARASIAELCDHIVAVHHQEARREMPRISDLLARVVWAHGGEHSEFLDLTRTFDALRAELEEHLAVEEDTVFPACRALAAGEASLDPDADALLRCEDDHRAAGEMLARMRELSGGYDAGRALCNTHRVLLDALRRFELELHQHVHEENNVLFPQVRALAAA